MDYEFINEMLIYTSSEVLLPIVESFWQSCDLLLEDIQKAIQQQNSVLLSSTAHALKGAAANVGALRLSKLAHHLQNISLEEAEIYLHAIQTTILETKNPLHNLLIDKI